MLQRLPCSALAASHPNQRTLHPLLLAKQAAHTPASPRKVAPRDPLLLREQHIHRRSPHIRATRHRLVAQP